MKTIGVLGGMGPESTAIFYQALIRQCQKQFGAKYDSDYPEIFIYNLPIPDVIEGLENEQATIDALVRATQKIESIGVDVIVMPCNTTHYFYPQMVASIRTPFICIFLAMAKKLRVEGYQKVGLLATETTIQCKSFDKDFDKNGIELLLPDPREQSMLTKIIRNILAGEKRKEDRNALCTIISSLRKRGAEAVVLACTDLPILLSQKDVDVKVFDTVETLAEATILYTTGKIGNEILE